MGNVKKYIFDVSDKLRVKCFYFLGGMQNNNKILTKHCGSLKLPLNTTLRL